MGKNMNLSFSDNIDYGNLETACLECPRCKQNPSYLHFDKPRIFQGYDSYEAKYYGWSGRGSLIVIPFFCEVCDSGGVEKMFLCLSFHKGQSFLWFFIAEKDDFLPDPNKDFSCR